MNRILPELPSSARQAMSSRRGIIMVLSAFLLVIMFGMMAFSIDVGHVLLKQTQAQAAADAAALAATAVLHDGPTAVADTVNEMLELNGFDAASLANVTVDIDVGIWDTVTRTFTPTGNYDTADSVSVTVTDNQIPSFFGSLMGLNKYKVSKSAIATAAGGPPRDIVIVIDCSTSMDAGMSNGLTRIENARAAAQALIDELGDKDRVALAVYSWYDNSRNKYQKTGIVETLLDFDHAPTYDRVGELEDGEYTSGTNIAGGFRAGLDIFLTSPPRPVDPNEPLQEVEQVMVMLTDGRTNKAEPYPVPDDGPTGMLPSLPFSGKYKSKKSVTKWANTIKARGIKVHTVTLGTSAYDPIMVDAASPPDGDTVYYHHIADGSNDAQLLLEVYKQIGKGDKPKLVK